MMSALQCPACAKLVFHGCGLQSGLRPRSSPPTTRNSVPACPREVGAVGGQRLPARKSLRPASASTPSCQPANVVRLLRLVRTTVELNHPRRAWRSRGWQAVPACSPPAADTPSPREEVFVPQVVQLPDPDPDPPLGLEECRTASLPSRAHVGPFALMRPPRFRYWHTRVSTVPSWQQAFVETVIVRRPPHSRIWGGSSMPPPQGSSLSHLSALASRATLDFVPLAVAGWHGPDGGTAS